MSSDIHRGNWFSKIFKHGKWYFISSFLTKGLGFFLLPIYSTYIDISDYGVLTTFNSIAQFMPIILSFYLDSAFGRFFHDFKEDKDKLSSLFSTIYWFVLLWGGLILSLVLLSSRVWFSNFFDVPKNPYIYLLFIPTLLNQLGQLGIIFLRQSLESKKTATIEVITSVLTAGVTVILLVLFNKGILARLYGTFTASVFIFIFYTVMLSRRGILKIHININILKNSLLYSIPLIPNIAGGWIASMSDRLVISKVSGFSSAGGYGFAAQIAIIIYVLQDAITQVQAPISMSGLIKDKEDTLKKMSDLSIFLWGFMLLVSLGSVFFAKEAVFILGRNEYRDSFYLIPILGFVYVLSSQYRIFSSVISYHKKVWVISSAGIISAIINLALNIIFVPLWGNLAASVATVASMFLYTFWIILWAKKMESIKLNLRKSLLLFLLYLGIIISSQKIYLADVSFGMFAIKLLLFITIGVVFSIVIYGFNKIKSYFVRG